MTTDHASSERKPSLAEVSAIILMLLNILLAGINESGSPTNLQKLIIALFFPAIVAVVVVGVIRVFGGARTRASVSMTVLVTMLVLLLGECGQLGKPRNPGRAGGSGGAFDPI